MTQKALEITLIGVLMVSSFFIGRNWRGRNSNPATSSFSDSQQQLANIKDQFLTLYETDLQDYARLKTMEAKYQSANDILAKMMTIFLAELGLRISKNEIHEITAPIKQEGHNALTGSNKACGPQKSRSQCPSLSQLAREQGKQVIDLNNLNKPKKPKWLENEGKISSIESEDDAKEFLKSVEIKNFSQEIASAKNVGNSGYEKFQGRFEGTLYFDDKDKAPADVFMELDGTIDENGKVVGKNEIKLSREGKVFSHSTGNGDIKNYKKPKSSEKTFFVDLGGKMGFLQVYFLDGGNVLIGNFYRQQDVAKFSKEGIVRLYRR